jgi:hypothetical protein
VNPEITDYDMRALHRPLITPPKLQFNEILTNTTIKDTIHQKDQRNKRPRQASKRYQHRHPSTFPHKKQQEQQQQHQLRKVVQQKQTRNGNLPYLTSTEAEQFIRMMNEADGIEDDFIPPPSTLTTNNSEMLNIDLPVENNDNNLSPGDTLFHYMFNEDSSTGSNTLLDDLPASTEWTLVQRKPKKSKNNTHKPSRTSTNTASTSTITYQPRPTNTSTKITRSHKQHSTTPPTVYVLVTNNLLPLAPISSTYGGFSNVTFRLFVRWGR